ncbi:putative disease resistance protein RGA3 [Beta vulgaris subsp. vulgaris]|uniref:putative disease resistance protein RGA3 n=1 Tax=Beta vulgaris subsp. vulgaris TaxID=3555 RepID=UPI0020373F4D|nr:putative disease resistance protein RGA3 [Beta vulgaris subsp. vulgaris]
MAEAIVSDIVVKLLVYMGESMVEKIAPYFNGRNKLGKLEQTMRMIQARLLDAERLREAENGALVKLWLKRLKHVLYRLEDLMEEIIVVDEGNEQMSGGKLTKPFHACFSISSSFKTTRKLAIEAKAIVEALKAITYEMHSLNLRVHPVHEQHSDNLTYRRVRVTHSFVLKEEVIGREADKREIVQMVSDSDNIEGNHVSVIPIVGIGGLGKTTLAQLVFNDENVQKHFEFKCWACISEISSSEELVRKILRSVSNDDFHHVNMEQLQIQLQRMIHNKRYLLVLDDIWDEDRERWLHLKRLLYSGKPGSKIIVTSRSRVVAINMGTVEPYELKGLSEDQSWELFKSLAFKEGEEERNQKLASIGREIVDKCANVPLAIRTIAGLLYSKDTETEWESFRDGELRMIEQNEGSIMSTLKLSYDHLPSQLKQCFAYCSVFPRNYVFRKQYLIDLWMAQGFIMSSHDSQSPEDVGDVYFMELLFKRSFFKDDVRGEDGDIISCKMHDLMHDLAQYMAGEDSDVVSGSKLQANDNIRHASIFVGSSWEVPSSVLAAKQMRSLLLLSHTTLVNMSATFSSLRCLRALDLLKADCESLPSSVGKLVHLRYFRLGWSIVFLSECMTMLHNLQTLDLRVCNQLKEFPRGFHKLINLRQLYNDKIGLKDLPLRFGQLTSLRTLDKFVVGKSNGLDALANLNNLAGKVEIYIKEYRKEAVSEAMMANLEGKKLAE